MAQFLITYSMFELTLNQEIELKFQLSLSVILRKIAKTHHYFSSYFLHQSVFTKRRDLCDNFINRFVTETPAWTCLLSSLWFYEQFYLTKITSQEGLAFYNCYLYSLYQSTYVPQMLLPLLFCCLIKNKSCSLLFQLLK